MFPSTSQPQMLDPNVNGPQRQPYAPGEPSLSQNNPARNNSDTLAEQYIIGTYCSDQPRSWEVDPRNPSTLSGRAKAARSDNACLREVPAKVKNSRSCNHLWDTDLSRQTGDRGLGDRQEPTTDLAWPSSLFDLGHQQSTYPSPPADKNSTGIQTRAEDEGGPRYVLQPVRQPIVQVPTISFPPSETYGERDDFPELFAKTYADLRSTPPSASPVVRTKTPESSTSTFEPFASPAFSTDGTTGTPTIDQVQPSFVTSRYWNDLEEFERVTSEPSAWWNNEQAAGTTPQQPGSRSASPMNAESYPLFTQCEDLTCFPENHPSAATNANNWSAFSLFPPISQDTAPTLVSSYQPPNTCITNTLWEEFGSSTTHHAEDVTNAAMWSALEQQIFPGACTTATVPPFTYPPINDQPAIHASTQAEQGLNPIRFIDRRRLSTQDPPRHDRSNMERLRKNHLLIKWKNEGMSYKDIKAKGNFKDAESTLRGRYRTLTKKKEDRVRKPEWQDRDVRLLRNAVAKYGRPLKMGLEGKSPSDHALKASKISWKSVAQFIWAKGGSYLYGNATCKKKWSEIQDGLPEESDDT